MQDMEGGESSRRERERQKKVWKGREEKEYSSHQYCDKQVKHIPGVPPEGLKIVDPLEHNFNREHDNCEAINEVQQLLKHH